MGAVDDTEFRRRVGGLLLTFRIQQRNWNESKAATEAGLTPKTIRRIERGLNYEMDSVEKYAHALGRPYHAWVLDVLRTELIEETQRAAQSDTAASAGKQFHNGTNGTKS